MSTREARREARRQEMLEAAMDLVLEDGLSSLTIAKIAKRLDAAVGALYRYFSGKDSLIAELQVLAIGELHGYLVARIEAMRSKRPESLPDSTWSLAQVVALFDAYLGHAIEHPATHSLIDHVLGAQRLLLTDEERQPVLEVLASLLETVEVVFDNATKAGALGEGDAALRTHLAWASYHGLDHFRLRDRWQPDHLQVHVLNPAMMKTLLLGWGAKPGELSLAQELAGSVATDYVEPG